MKLLIVTFYFPPAGGGGVQRVLKVAQLLPEYGIETHVLTPEDPQWIHRDEELEVPAGLPVHRCRYIGPRGRRPAEELYGLDGVRRLARRASLAPRRLFVPDENASWALTAVPAGLRVARREGFDAVMTSSPPSSVHVIGAILSRKLGIPWIADLRDSIVAKEDRRVDRPLVRVKERTHASVAALVAAKAAAIVGVTPTICAEMERLKPRGRVVTIPNGADFEDFHFLSYRPAERFRITHTGSFFGQRSPRPFLTALAQSGLDVAARFVGDFRAADRDWAHALELGDKLELYPFVSHRQSLALQRDSDALLLLLPEIGERGKDIPSGKLYEYIAARRPILAAVPPDGAAAELIREAGVGVIVDPDDVDGIRGALESLVERWRQRELPDTSLRDDLRASLSRRARVEELAQLLADVTDEATSPARTGALLERA
ncbi:MAG TPA: glycosyltransferase [Gaiellaceae bacterium]|nr:glycosyltransferase [Gaiellaceae bacterium]